MKRSRLKETLRKHEGLRLKPYRCPAGKLTIGYGRNLEDVGITEDEAEVLLDNDVLRVWDELSRHLPGTFTALDEVRQHVLLNMAFMGVSKLLGFTKMWAAIESRDFEAAAREMLDSKWARQVGDRAVELARMMRTGAD